MSEYKRLLQDQRSWDRLKERLSAVQALYESFDAAERTMADQVLSEWVLSADENVRFDALALIHRCKICEAVPATSEIGHGPYI